MHRQCYQQQQRAMEFGTWHQHEPFMRGRTERRNRPLLSSSHHDEWMMTMNTRPMMLISMRLWLRCVLLSSLLSCSLSPRRSITSISRLMDGMMSHLSMRIKAILDIIDVSLHRGDEDGVNNHYIRVSKGEHSRCAIDNGCRYLVSNIDRSQCRAMMTTMMTQSDTMLMQSTDQWFIYSSIYVLLSYIIVLFRAASSRWSLLLVPPSSVCTHDRNISLLPPIRSPWVFLLFRSNALLSMVSYVRTSARKNCVRISSRSIVGVRYAGDDACSPPPCLLVIAAPSRCAWLPWNRSSFRAHICMALLCDALFHLLCRVLPRSSPSLLVRWCDHHMDHGHAHRCDEWTSGRKRKSSAEMHSHREGDGKTTGVGEERGT